MRSVETLDQRIRSNNRVQGDENGA